ncbi:hypothetical protein HY251_10460 [bacterium]|nr:hypothetical protein [bacterium]
MKARRAALAAALVLVSLPWVRTIAAGPAVRLAGPTDMLVFCVPAASTHRESVRAGELPLWKTQLYGQATAGEPQERVFYPPMLLSARSRGCRSPSISS